MVINNTHMKKVIDFILLQNSVNKQISENGEANHDYADRLNDLGDSLSIEEIDTLCKYANRELILAIFIDSVNKSYKYILIEPTIEEYYKLLGFRLIEGAYPFKSRNHIYVDEEGFLKPNPNLVFYKGLDNYIAGNAIVIGSDDEGNDLSTTITLEHIRTNIFFLNN